MPLNLIMVRWWLSDLGYRLRTLVSPESFELLDGGPTAFLKQQRAIVASEPWSNLHHLNFSHHCRTTWETVSFNLVKLFNLVSRLIKLGVFYYVLFILCGIRISAGPQT